MMIIEGIDSVDINDIYPGCTIKLKLVDNVTISSLIDISENLGCKLILLNYGEFYLREYRSYNRNDIIDSILIDL